jgi:hypothetical protein
MRAVKNIFLLIATFCFLVLSCGGSSESPEVKARRDFAWKAFQDTPFHVSYGVDGKDKDILDITV